MGRSTDQWRLKTGECSEAKASRLKAEAVARAIDESWRVTGRERRRDPPGTAEATEWTMHGMGPSAVWNHCWCAGLRARIASEEGESDSPAESRRDAERDTKSRGVWLCHVVMLSAAPAEPWKRGAGDAGLIAGAEGDCPSRGVMVGRLHSPPIVICELIDGRWVGR